VAEGRKLRVGLIGIGWIGQHHGQNVIANPHAELAAVYNPSEEKAKIFLQRSGCRAAVCRSLEELLKRDDVEAVVIASPNAAHAEQAIAAAQAGKHIYLEKPMAITLEQCRRIAAAVRKAGVKLDMGYHRRLNPIVQYARGLIAEGKLGELVFVESDYFHHVPGDWDIWAWAGKKDIAGTPIHGGTGHNIDLLRYFCGEVAEVSCFRDVKMPRRIQMETEDIAVLNLRFESGVLGRVGLFLGPILPFRFTLRLFGTRGTVDNNRVWLDSIPRFHDFGHEQDCITLPRSWVPDNLQGGVAEPWKQAIDLFIDDVRLDRQPFNDAASGFNTAAVCFAALQAAAEKRSLRPERL
jgi:UDP-N-acetyl-2-amino-2-deoxyglucuronate dehydrogenase